MSNGANTDQFDKEITDGAVDEVAAPAEHYYTAKPTGEKKIENTFRFTIGPLVCFFKTASGMFSLDHVDIGSAVLIKYAHVEPNWHILDLGCGYGPVGIFLKKKEPSLKVTFSDINERATEYAMKNVMRNKLDHKDIKIKTGEGFSQVEGMEFDAIYLNPPHSAGKKLCLSLIEQAKDYLKVGGSLQIVARKSKGGLPLANFMEEHFGNIKVLKKKSGFWVWESFRE